MLVEDVDGDGVLVFVNQELTVNDFYNLDEDIDGDGNLDQLKMLMVTAT